MAFSYRQKNAQFMYLNNLETLLKEIRIKRFSCIAEYVHFDFYNEDDAATFLNHMKESLKGTMFDGSEIECENEIDNDGVEIITIKMPLLFLFFTIFTVKEWPLKCKE